MAEEAGAGKVALVAGVTGIVGLSLAEQLLDDKSWRVYGLARRPKPSWFLHPLHAYIQCDLLHRHHTLASLSPLTDVTHLFFTTWTNRDAEDDNVRANGDMLQNTLDALLPFAKDLKHVCLLTGAKQYLGPFDVIRTLSDHVSCRIFDEDTPRLPGPNFYYTQEDILLKACTSKASLTWSVHRAGSILGVSPNSLVNIALFLAAYACICKYDEEGLAFIFPGDLERWESHLEASDSHLIAEQLIWAATHPAGHNQCLNIANGDSVAWRDIWLVTASFFEIEAHPYSTDGSTVSVVDIMQSKAHVWERIVSQCKLQTVGWEEGLMFGWQILDLGFHHLPVYSLSMVKSARLGFAGACDTKTSLLRTFQNMRKMRIIP